MGPSEHIRNFCANWEKALLPPTGSSPSPVDSEGSVPLASSLHSLLPRTPRCEAWLPLLYPPSPTRCAPQNRNCKVSVRKFNNGCLGAHLCIHRLYYLKAGLTSRLGCFTKLCYLNKTNKSSKPGIPY